MTGLAAVSTLPVATRERRHFAQLAVRENPGLFDDWMAIFAEVGETPMPAQVDEISRILGKLEEATTDVREDLAVLRKEFAERIIIERDERVLYRHQQEQEAKELRAAVLQLSADVQNLKAGKASEHSRIRFLLKVIAILAAAVAAIGGAAVWIGKHISFTP